MFSCSKKLNCYKLLFSSVFVSGLLQAEAPTNLGSTTVFVPYANASTNTNLNDSPTINLGFDNSSQYFQFIMDTGSVGIVASEDIFTPAPGAQNLGPGFQFYSSSGIIENGTWWTAVENIYDANGNLVARANSPVLQVNKITCAPHARDCTPDDHPTGIALMGIGFARESPQQPRGTPAYNAFLNLFAVLQNGILQPLPSDWTNGYVVTPIGVYLGLTPTNTANAGWVKLAPWPQFSTPQLPEWMPAPMTISVNGTTGNGNILMDTGVGDGFLTPPPGTDTGALVQCPGTMLVECIPDGTVVSTYLPNQTNPVAFYTFTVGESDNEMQPDGTHIVGGTDIFFNTSRHVLAGINFAYDNRDGFIGYIWNGLSDNDIGYVIPSATLPTVNLVSSENPIEFGDKVRITVKVTPSNPTVLTATGIVTLFINGKPKDHANLDGNGSAIFTISNLPPLAHIIRVHYSGDNLNSAASSSFKLNVTPKLF